MSLFEKLFGNKEKQSCKKESTEKVQQEEKKTAEEKTIVFDLTSDGGEIIKEMSLEEAVKEADRRGVDMAVIDGRRQEVVMEVGKRFPWERYLKKGDHVWAALNKDNFDVVIVYNGIVEQEQRAFEEEKIHVSVFGYECVPFVVMNFGGKMLFDFQINVKKFVEQKYREEWPDKPSKEVKMFFVESSTGILKGIRVAQLRCSAAIKDIARQQKGMSMEQIDEITREGQARFGVGDFVRMAQDSEVVI